MLDVGCLKADALETNAAFSSMQYLIKNRIDVYLSFFLVIFYVIYVECKRVRACVDYKTWSGINGSSNSRKYRQY